MKLRITQTRSPIGTRASHRGTLRALGLRKIGQSTVREDTPELRGMIRSVHFMVRVEEETGG